MNEFRSINDICWTGASTNKFNIIMINSKASSLNMEWQINDNIHDKNLNDITIHDLEDIP